MALDNKQVQPPRWKNQDLLLYHGTLDIHVTSIKNAVNVARGNQNTDFGTGFYTTTVERQAQAWAGHLSQRSQWTANSGHPAVVRFIVKWELLAALEAIWFVRGNPDALDYWSLIFHCRTGRSYHGRRVTKPGWYDVAIGPVAIQWRKMRVLADSDQISFHTCKGEGILNASKRESQVFNSGTNQWENWS
jgi:hypothetical protein